MYDNTSETKTITKIHSLENSFNVSLEQKQ
jgi:hypothetical protein